MCHLHKLVRIIYPITPRRKKSKMKKWISFAASLFPKKYSFGRRVVGDEKSIFICCGSPNERNKFF